MRQTVTITKNTEALWFPDIGEVVEYKTKTSSRHLLAVRLEPIANDYGCVRFAYLDNGVIGDTVFGTEKAIRQAIKAGRCRPYTGSVTVSQD